MTMTYPMSFSWRCCFYVLIGIGALAAIYCGASLIGIQIGPEGKQPSTAEAWVGLSVGILLQPFAWTGLRHGKIELSDTRLCYLGFGPVCTTRTVELATLKRFGTGAMKGSGGGRQHMLIMELDSGAFVEIKLSMYERWRELLRQLGAQLGKEPQETKRTLAGLRFSNE